MRGTREIRRILPDEPIQKLLKRLSRKRPEENKRVRRPKAAFTELEQRRALRVESVLQDDCPDPRADEHKDDRSEGDFGASLDIDLLAVEQVANDEGGENPGEVGEERRERARLDSLGLEGGLMFDCANSQSTWSTMY